jgi:hypothetical protein
VAPSSSSSRSFRPAQFGLFFRICDGAAQQHLNGPLLGFQSNRIEPGGRCRQLFGGATAISRVVLEDGRHGVESRVNNHRICFAKRPQTIEAFPRRAPVPSLEIPLELLHPVLEVTERVTLDRRLDEQVGIGCRHARRRRLFILD